MNKIKFSERLPNVAGHCAMLITISVVSKLVCDTPIFVVVPLALFAGFAAYFVVAFVVAVITSDNF